VLNLSGDLFMALYAHNRRDGDPDLREAKPGRGRRILFLVSAHNGLSQRAAIALTELGHSVTVAVVDSAAAMEAAVATHRPDLIACPFLKKLIPESIWSRHRCLVVHPGPVGDRGPSSLDWAIELGADSWGVTVLQANGEFDAGDVSAERAFPVRAAGKGSLYRHEVRRAAVQALVEAVDTSAAPRAVDYDDARVIGRPRPLMTQEVRAIDWRRDATDVVVRKIRAAEGDPGVLDAIDGEPFHLFGVHREAQLAGPAGEIVAQRDGAICRATVDGAVWITHLKGATPFKLPATRALALAARPVAAPEVSVPVHTARPLPGTYREIVYEEDAGVGYLHFDFHNGAMSTAQCRRLREAYAYARSRRQTRVIALMGGTDFFANGIHLHVIEAADDPAEESWRNLNAIDDVVHDVVETGSHLVISALSGDAAAGGVPFALAADHVFAREDVVLNPYYRHMGGLYGSEYWTYLLPRRVGAEAAARLTSAPFAAVGSRQAVEVGLLDAAFGATVADFRAGVRRLAEGLAADPGLERWLEGKRRRRARDEEHKPLLAYRTEELVRCHECFFGEDRGYHEARRRFVHKLGAPCAVPARPAPARLPAAA
jgi:putative two-component system hydrogenase maturation factor HypX/HoxX